MPDHTLSPSQRNTLSQLSDLGAAALPKTPEAITPVPSLASATLETAASLGSVDFNTEISRAEQKLQAELKSLTASVDTVVQLEPTLTESPKTQVKEELGTYTTKKPSSGMQLPIILKDPLGFLAALIKVLENAVLGSLYELNQTPEGTAVHSNLTKEKDEAELAEKEAAELKAKALAERLQMAGLASDGSMLREARISRSDDSGESDSDKN